MPASDIRAVVPVKDFSEAKQRLSAILTRDERMAFYAAMLEDVLAALAASTALGGVLVVTRDAAARTLAERYGAEVLAEPENRGHTAASTLGAAELARRGVTGMLQVPGDLPLLRREDVEAILAAHGRAPSVTIAPSGDEKGSNAVACSPPDLLPLRFGDDSFHPHCRAAEVLGVTPRIVRRPGFELDIDTPEDLKAFLAHPSEARAYRYLVTSGIAERMCGQAVTKT